jgi:cation diffusion facilitator CzcD-associated flavoprotein CzcO
LGRRVNSIKTNKDKNTNSLDVIIVGAGFAGIYMLYKMREMGFSARILDAASGVGGTWFWNRYPGARCDVDNMFYSYSFDEDLEQEWEWSERYPAQAEILNYINHVVDRFNLRPDVQLGTRVASAIYDESNASWLVATEDGEKYTAKFCVMATGCLSAANLPDFKGLETFKGRVFHTGHWPDEEIDFTDRRVGVVGTGSSGVQVIPQIAKQAEHLTVFQRTASYVVEAFNHPLDASEKAHTKAHYKEMREAAKKTFGGFTIVASDQSALSVSEDECREKLEEGWQDGGNSFLTSYGDFGVNENANMRAQDFVRDKIREAVNDPETADKLMPRHIIGCKRLCLGTNYYDTYNRDNVSLVSLGKKGVEGISSDSLLTEGAEYPLDDLVLATGFDAMTGALNRMDIQGRDNVSLKKAWEAGPKNYLGLMTHGFPNFFMVTGPGSPSVLSNMLPTIEHHVEWISDCIDYLRTQNIGKIEADLKAQDEWVAHGNEIASKTLRYTCSSWYLGTNVPGKPRIFMPYIGGMPAYREKCAAVVTADYEGFELT